MMFDKLPRSHFNTIAAFLLDFGSLQKLCKQLWPEVARYPRTSCWTGALIIDGLSHLQCGEPWDDASSARLRRLIHVAGLQVSEMEAFIGTCKSVGRAFLHLLSYAVKKHENLTDEICFFLAKSNSSLLLSCLLKCQSLDAIGRLNGNYPNPDRYSGSSLGHQSEGNLLHVAVAWSANSVVKVFVDVLKRNQLALDSTDSISETPLFLAVKIGNEQMVSLLLEAVADVNTMSGLAYLDKIGKKLDTDYYNAVTPLTVACMQQNVNVVRLLLQHGAEPNAGNGVDMIPSPLMAMFYDSCNHTRKTWSVSRARDILALLTDCKADVNGRPGHVDICSPFRSSVFVAARDPWRGVLELLLQRKGNVNAADGYGDGPLHVAVMHTKSRDSVQKLLDNGADIHQENGDGVPAAVPLTVQGWKYKNGAWQWKAEWAAPFAAAMKLQISP